MPTHPKVTYRCSFCGKSQEQVHRLIAGPGGVYICEECIELCTEIISEESQTAAHRIERVRTLVRETRDRYGRDGSLCSLCRNALQESEAKLVVATYEGNPREERHVVWRCHATCFHEESKNLP